MLVENHFVGTVKSPKCGGYHLLAVGKRFRNGDDIVFCTMNLGGVVNFLYVNNDVYRNGYFLVVGLGELHRLVLQDRRPLFCPESVFLQSIQPEHEKPGEEAGVTKENHRIKVRPVEIVAVGENKPLLNIRRDQYYLQNSRHKKQAYRKQPEETVSAAGEQFRDGEPACDEHHRSNHPYTYKLFVNVRVAYWTERGEPNKEKTGDKPKNQVESDKDSFSVCLKKYAHFLVCLRQQK